MCESEALSSPRYEAQYSIRDLLSMSAIPIEVLLDSKQLKKNHVCRLYFDDQRRVSTKTDHGFLGCTPSNYTKYTPYVSLREALAGLASGKYKSGVLRVAKGRADDAFISNEIKENPDYLVHGRTDRNRAVHGDTVVFEVYPKDTWIPVMDLFSIVDTISVEENKSSLCCDSTKVQSLHPTVKVVYILEFEGKDRCYVALLQENRLFDQNAHEKSPSALGSGENPDFIVRTTDRFVKAVPFDTRIPWILLPVADLAKWIEVPGVVDGSCVFRIQMVEWECDNTLPTGSIKGVVGSLSDLNVLERIAMEENGLGRHMNNFSPVVLREVESLLETYNQSFKSQIPTRRDFRSSDVRVFTIDPPTARDLDDAIHIRIDHSVTPPEFEIGVHIADVGYFVNPLTAIDEEASNRCTTVYLPRRNFPMLPPALCQDLCSLRPHEDKLTFSVVFFVDSQGNPSKKKPPWFGRSVIRSVAQLNYEEVQKVLHQFRALQKDPRYIAKNTLEQCVSMEDVRPDACHKSIWPEIWSDLVLLESMTQQIRQRRDERGGLRLHSSNFYFNLDEYLSVSAREGSIAAFMSSSITLDEEVNLPEYHDTAHHLIEELMLITNVLVAEKLYHSVLSDFAVLRCHPGPKSTEITQFSNFLSTLQLPPDVDTAKALHNLFCSVEKRHGKHVQYALEHLFVKSLQCANYVVNENNVNPHHFALNFPLYTHFTSPIRRYSDLMVHRLLSYVILLQDDPALTVPPDTHGGHLVKLDKHTIQEALSRRGIHLEGASMITQCDKCNLKRLQAKDASVRCSLAFFSFWLNRVKQLLPTIGSAIRIQEKRFLVFMPLVVSVGHVYYNVTQNNTNAESKGVPKNQLSLPLSITHRTCKIEIVWEVPVSSPKETDGVPSTHSSWTTSCRTIRQTVHILGPVPLYLVPFELVPQGFAVFLIPPWSPDFAPVILNSTWINSKQKKEFHREYEKAPRTGILDLGGIYPRDSMNDIEKPTLVDDRDPSTKLFKPRDMPPLVSTSQMGDTRQEFHNHPNHLLTNMTTGNHRSTAQHKRGAKYTDGLEATARIIHFNLRQTCMKSNTQTHGAPPL